MIYLTQCNDPLAGLLAALVVCPLVIGLLLMLMPMSRRVGNALGLATVTMVLVGSVLLWKSFQPVVHGYAFFSSMNLGLEALGARWQLGLNAISMPMFGLTALVGAAAGWATAQMSLERKNLLWGCVLMTLSGVLGAFASVDLFYGFLMHEVALLPTLIALMVFGGAQRRQATLEAGLFMLAGSLVMLLGLLGMRYVSGVGSFSAIAWQQHLLSSASVLDPATFLWLGVFILGAAILSGLWPFYTWVPKLLTQAPAPIAMLQGGALKFFGLYFVVQAALPILGEGNWQAILAILCAANIFFVGLSALGQTDLLKMVALLAVMHMGALFLALIAPGVEALGGLTLAMLGSGLATALVILVASYLRHRVGSLQMPHIGGLRAGTPRLAFCLMIGMMALIALPCFVGFWGELGIIFGLIAQEQPAVVALLLGLVLAAAVGLRALGGLLMGSPKPPALADLNSQERFAAWLLILPLILFAFFPSVITTALDTFLRAFL